MLSETWGVSTHQTMSNLEPSLVAFMRPCFMTSLTKSSTSETMAIHAHAPFLVGYAEGEGGAVMLQTGSLAFFQDSDFLLNYAKAQGQTTQGQTADKSYDVMIQNYAASVFIDCSPTLLHVNPADFEFCVFADADPPIFFMYLQICSEFLKLLLPTGHRNPGFGWLRKFP